ncbi:transcription initiation factor IIA large subunit-like protein [Trifolium pratense]|uniref:Transcription initiation factor IIA large subunit-like protein n=2 Tax=Trifolium TaxID=3898 RepID=A0A2K3P237_TRIPR|nr:transcription initiation factor IIA large subunit-like protein [Trifolium pratense]
MAAAASSTSQVYIDVIEDVMTKVRDEFVNNGGPGEEVLRELQAIWESKMMQAGAVVGPIERTNGPNKPTPPVHDLNVPYEGNEEYETPTAEILFPPTPLQTPIQTPLPGTGETPSYNIPTGQSDYSSGNDTGANADLKGGRTGPYMQPPSPWMMNQRPPLDVNVAYVEGRDEADRGASNQPTTQDFFQMPGGKRKRNDLPPPYDAGGYIPQQDGAGDVVSGDFEIEGRDNKTTKWMVLIGTDLFFFGMGIGVGLRQGGAPGMMEFGGIDGFPNNSLMISSTSKLASTMVCGGSISFSSQHTNSKGKIPANLERLASSSRIPQLDGPIPYEDDVLSTPNIYNYGGVYSEDYNIANTPAPPEVPVSTPALVAQNEVVNDDEDDEPPLNENDDDDLDDLDQGDDQNTSHLVLAQFDKVTRTKSRWKCTLKDGIMHINNKDILFNKANGEFDF